MPIPYVNISPFDLEYSDSEVLKEQAKRLLAQTNRASRAERAKYYAGERTPGMNRSDAKQATRQFDDLMKGKPAQGQAYYGPREKQALERLSQVRALEQPAPASNALDYNDIERIRAEARNLERQVNQSGRKVDRRGRTLQQASEPPKPNSSGLSAEERRLQRESLDRNRRLKEERAARTRTGQASRSQSPPGAKARINPQTGMPEGVQKPPAAAPMKTGYAPTQAELGNLQPQRGNPAGARTLAEGGRGVQVPSHVPPKGYYTPNLPGATPAAKTNLGLLGADFVADFYTQMQNDYSRGVVNSGGAAPFDVNYEAGPNVVDGAKAVGNSFADTLMRAGSGFLEAGLGLPGSFVDAGANSGHRATMGMIPRANTELEDATRSLVKQATGVDLREEYGSPAPPAPPTPEELRTQAELQLMGPEPNTPDFVREMLPQNKDNTEGQYAMHENGFDFTQPNRAQGAGSLRKADGTAFTKEQLKRFEQTLGQITKMSPHQKAVRAQEDAAIAALQRKADRAELKDDLEIRKMEAELADVGGGTGDVTTNQVLKAVDRMGIQDKDKATRLKATIEPLVMGDPFYKQMIESGKSPQEAAMMAMIQNEMGGTPLDQVTSAERQGPLGRAGGGVVGNTVGLLWNLLTPKHLNTDMGIRPDLEFQTPDPDGIFSKTHNYRLDLDKMVKDYGLSPSQRALLERLGLSLDPEE